MKLFSLLFRYSKRDVIITALTAAIGGISSTGLLALINIALRGDYPSTKNLVIAFSGLCILMIISRVVGSYFLIRLTTKALYDLRMRLTHHVLSSPLRRLEEMGIHRILAAMTDDVNQIITALAGLPFVLRNVVVVIASLIYMAWLSIGVFLATLCFILVGIVSYQLLIKRASRYLRLAREEWDSMFGHFRSLTEGIKELKIHRARRQAFRTEVLEPTGRSFEHHNIVGMTINSAAAAWGQTLSFIVIGLLLFAVPSLTGIEASTLIGFSLVLVYVITPLDSIMNWLPTMTRANIAVRKINELGLSLEPYATESSPTHSPSNATQSWHELRLAGVTHTYHRESDNSSFVLGPIDFSLHPGELIFIVGGNGSGKTTLAKLLIGLYVPEAGQIIFNGEPITDSNRDDYRQYFSVVFSDFHLFNNLLGLEKTELDTKAYDYLSLLQLNHKVEVKEGKLSTINLSQGQRKRLALLTAYLEDRSIYLFDEWAADQDPTFKDFFYMNLLPELKSRGKTIIVISHDDKYYQFADRVVKLDYGQILYDTRLVEEKSPLDTLMVQETS
jgi:putative pyoverdin transport system ATP-binding/permease protein